MGELADDVRSEVAVGTVSVALVTKLGIDACWYVWLRTGQSHRIQLRKALLDEGVFQSAPS